MWMYIHVVYIYTCILFIRHQAYLVWKSHPPDPPCWDSGGRGQKTVLLALSLRINWRTPKLLLSKQSQVVCFWHRFCTDFFFFKSDYLSLLSGWNDGELPQTHNDQDVALCSNKSQVSLHVYNTSMSVCKESSESCTCLHNNLSMKNILPSGLA